jgi:23S rRNA-/tRNA-specific pseudouridylate synthase
MPFLSSPSERVPLSATAVADLRRKVLYEDTQLLVLNKPAGLACHAGTGQREKHLDAMLWALEEQEPPPQQQEQLQPDYPPPQSLRLVHRLDKETSGCLLLAKGRHVADILSALLSKPAAPEATGAALSHTPLSTSSPPAAFPSSPQQLPSYSASVWDAPSTGAFVQKRYLALVHGRPSVDAGVLLSASESGGLNHTSYRVLASTSPSSSAVCSLVELQPHTGRKRQLRLHCHAQLGCTIVGEQLRMLGVSERAAASSAHRRASQDDAIRQQLGWNISSASSGGTPRALPLCLHAHELLLRHPSLHDGSLLHVQAPLPPPFAKLCRTLFGWSPSPLNQQTRTQE